MKKFPLHWKPTPVSNDEPWLKPEHSGTPEARTPEDGRTLPPRAQSRGATLNMESAGAPGVYRAEGPAHAPPRPYRSLIGRSRPSTLLSGKLLANYAVTLSLTCSLEQVNKNCSRTPPGAGRSVDLCVAGTAASGKPLGHWDGFASSLSPFSPQGRSGLQGLGRALARSWRLVGAFRALPTTLHLASDSWHGLTVYVLLLLLRAHTGAWAGLELSFLRLPQPSGSSPC